MGKVIPFITGAAIGALAALAFAPQTGEKTRAMVTERANSLMGEAKDFGAGMPGTAQDAFNNLRDMGAGLLKDAPGKAQEIASSVKGGAGQAPAESNDELREKIEAARRRIAAQVMENAEQSNAVEVAAEAAEDVKEEVAEAAKDAKEEVAAAVEEAKAE